MNYNTGAASDPVRDKRQEEMGLILQHARTEIALGSDEHSQKKQGSTAGAGGCASMAATSLYQN